jgi:hypothetical protein
MKQKRVKMTKVLRRKSESWTDLPGVGSAADHAARKL